MIFQKLVLNPNEVFSMEMNYYTITDYFYDKYDNILYNYKMYYNKKENFG